MAAVSLAKAGDRKNHPCSLYHHVRLTRTASTQSNSRLRAGFRGNLKSVRDTRRARRKRQFVRSSCKRMLLRRSTEGVTQANGVTRGRAGSGVVENAPARSSGRPGRTARANRKPKERPMPGRAQEKGSSRSATAAQPATSPQAGSKTKLSAYHGNAVMPSRPARASRCARALLLSTQNPSLS